MYWKGTKSFCSPLSTSATWNLLFHCTNICVPSPWLPNIEKNVLPSLLLGEKTLIMFWRKPSTLWKGLCKAAHFLEFWRLPSSAVPKMQLILILHLMAVQQADSRTRWLIGNTEHEGEGNNKTRETTEKHYKEEDFDVSPWCDFVTNICCFFSSVWQVHTNFHMLHLQFFI